MSGILDNRSRVMDTIVTLEGRRQLANAGLKIDYVSFTDAGVYYAADIASGTADATIRLYLEQCHLPQDQITLEANDSGHLVGFMNEQGLTVNNGQIITYSFLPLTSSIVSGSNQSMNTLSGEEFASTAESLLVSSTENFNKLRMIGTKDRIFEDDGFGMGNKQIEFVINDDKPLADQSTHATHLNYLESLYQDIRLSNVTNFKYLPPINKLDDATINKRDYRNTTRFQLGNYPPWGRTHVDGLTPNQLEAELEFFERLGYTKTINFDPTSMKNSLVGQFFEVNFNTMKKLDVIDYGPYVWQGQKRHAFFAGKVMTDGNGSHTFIHLFTLVFG